MLNTSIGWLQSRPFRYDLTPGKTSEIVIENKTAEMSMVSIVWQEELAYLVSLRDISAQRQARTNCRIRSVNSSSATRKLPCLFR